MSLINITIPARNEEVVLAGSIQKIADFCHTNLTDDWFIVIADSASTDKTPAIGQSLANQNPHIKYCRADLAGKGLAVRLGWTSFPADYYVFMDADLATDLTALPQLLAGLKNGADIVIGSRYLPQSRINRSTLRLTISNIYRWLARHWLGLPFSDLACGFKGMNHRTVQELLPQINPARTYQGGVKNNEWFFDTELLYRAWKAGGNCHSERSRACLLAGRESLLPNLRDSSAPFVPPKAGLTAVGMTVKEVPVNWREAPSRGRKSRVGILRVSWNYLKEMVKLRTSPR